MAKLIRLKCTGSYPQPCGNFFLVFLYVGFVKILLIINLITMQTVVPSQLKLRGTVEDKVFVDSFALSLSLAKTAFDCQTFIRSTKFYKILKSYEMKKGHPFRQPLYL